MALNTEFVVRAATDEEKNTKLFDPIISLCLEYAARVTIPATVSDVQFELSRAQLATIGIRITRYPRWYLGDDDDTGRGMDRITFEATNRDELLRAFDKKAGEVFT